MAEKTTIEEKHVTMKGAIVTPLDNPRTFDYDYVLINATTATSGILYTGSSGKVVYVHSLLVCEYSGNTGGQIQITNAADGPYNPATPWITVDENTCVCWKPCSCPLGPFAYSGASGGGGVGYNIIGIHGAVTLIVQVDPKRIE